MPKLKYLREYLTLGSAGWVVTQFRPPQASDFGGGGPQSPIYIDAVTGLSYIYVNGAIVPLARTEVDVASFGGVSGGVVDATPAFLRAFASLTPFGGTVFFSGDYLIDTNLAVPDFVTISGPGGRAQSLSSPATMGKTASLIVNSAATITLGLSAGIEAAIIRRKGMTLVESSSAAFAGTAVSIPNASGFVRDSTIFGFNLGIRVTIGQVSISNVFMDNNNGIDVTTAFDVVRLDNVHCWPFATVLNAGVGGNQRSGSAFYLHDSVDAPMLSGCFSYGYLNGFYFKGASTIMVTNCDADGDAAYAASAGWRFEGAINGFTSAACGAWSSGNGIVINTNAGEFIPLRGFGPIANNMGAGVRVESGDTDILDNHLLFNLGGAIRVITAASRVYINDNTFSGTAPPIIACDVATTNVLIGNRNRYVESLTAGLSGTNCTAPIIASASQAVPWTQGDLFIVSGSVQIDTLEPAPVGRTITLVFQSNPLVKNSTGTSASMRLSGGSDFAAAANATLTLKHTGNQWFEIGRSA